MSDKNLNRDERMKEIRQYLDGKMSDSERNNFERKLQADPFDEEALEGLKNLQAGDLDKDIRSMKKRLKNRAGSRTPFYYRIAAAVVVLMAISSLLLVRELKSPPMMVSESISQNEDTLIEPGAPRSAIKTPDEAGEAKSIPEIDVESAREATGVKSDALPEAETVVKDLAEENVLIADMDVSEESVAVDTGMIRKDIEVAIPTSGVKEEQAALAGVEAKKTEDKMLYSERAAKKANVAAAPVSSREKAAEEAVALSKDEAVISDTEELKVIDNTGSIDTNLKDRAPEPLGGIKDFRKYIETDQIFPADWTGSNRETVRLEITVGQEGEIKKIEVLKTPSKAFSDEAVRLVKEGPPWLPATRDYVRVEESIKIRIVFSR
jgi:hypothetical protein